MTDPPIPCRPDTVGDTVFLLCRSSYARRFRLGLDSFSRSLCAIKENRLPSGQGPGCCDRVVGWGRKSFNIVHGTRHTHTHTILREIYEGTSVNCCTMGGSLPALAFVSCYRSRISLPRGSVLILKSNLSQTPYTGFGDGFVVKSGNGKYAQQSKPGMSGN